MDGRRRLALWVPHVLLAVPFFLAGRAYAFWVPLVLAIVVLLARAGFVELRDADPRPGGHVVRGPVLAVLVAATVLLEFGALLAVRLVVVPDPRTPAAAAFTSDRLSAGWSALAQPLLGILAVSVALAVAARHSARFRGWALWARRGDLTGSAARPVPFALLLTVVTIPFLLPVLSGAGGVALTLGPVAAPEYGKLAFCAALAYVVARDSFRFQDVRLLATLREIRRAATGRGHRTTLVATYRASRFLLLPLALFGAVAVASGVRHDFGTVVPAALTTLGATWCATRHNLDRDHLDGEPVRRTVSLLLAYRLFIGAGVVLIAAGIALFTTDYVGERGRVWNDPWRFRWDAPCAVVDAPPEVLRDVPPGHVPCLRSLPADAESEDSQIARAIAATADGGLWGRGLDDRVSAAVTAGPTDFVLAVVWNKLGALVVIGAALLIAVLSAALIRAAAVGDTDRPSPLLLFATGLGTTITGQFLFVLAATANVVPHTGIPAPFLSRGGQSTLALGAGIALLLMIESVRNPVPPGTPEAHPRPVRRLTAAAAAIVPAGIVAGLTLNPYAAPRLADPRLPTTYAQHRPLCTGRTADKQGLALPPPDPEVCSTDVIALTRTRTALTFPGGGRLVLDRGSGDWRPEQPDRLAGLTADDLGGLLHSAAILRRTYPEALERSAGSRLRDRLWPPRPDRVDGGLALTLDPRAQHAVAEALRTPGPAAAVVVLDTDTGRILVSAATGGSAGEPTRADPEAERRFAEEHGHYARPGADGRLDDGAADPDCVRRSGDGTGQDGCWRWSYTAPAPVAKPDGALGRAYPFRAGADLVAAAAALGGADDDVPGQARKLGLRVGSCTGPDRWPVVPLAGSVASCLPERGEARGTPLALAVMTAAVANGGRTVRPRLVEQVTYPRTGLTVRVPGRSPAAAFPAGAARRLRADRYPTVDGLRQLSAVSRGSDRTYRWTCGFPESGALAFALVVEARDGDEADIRSRQLLASIRPSMEVPR